MSYLQAIAPFSGKDNIGSVLDLQVARKADIVFIPPPVGGAVYGAIQFQPGKGFTSWSAIHETASLTGDGKVSREGFSKTNKLPFRVPKGRSFLSAMFDRASDDELIVLFKENGKTKIFGLLEAPVKFQYSHNTGSAINDQNHYTCQFYYDGPENIYEFDGEVVVAPGGAAPAIVRFNGSVIASLHPGETFHITSEFGFTDFYTSAGP